ncbi:acyltransferase domain-containing protein [Streptomyces roseirectus]|uniref:Acyltransferase domain-containing protein n=1 Tax=Streptomyces roseirectus TaxID=2768066 RepID=A0A7H0I5V0_9ACTN|nr:acyltransferase domain-containing protein [Streptomyces roseirectus]QNP68166.1 acyltransferase domain-containing protein [Streptomyces roseirectus]
MPRCVVLFPGQGAYVPGALGALAETESVVGEVLAEVDRAAAGLGRDPVSRLLLDTRAPTLGELVEGAPQDLHLAIFASEAALFRLLTERLGVRPDVLLGHSFGELVALVAAGVHGLADGVALVAARDEAFAACPPRAGGMVALEVSAVRAAHLVAALAESEVCVAADNGPRQSVVSGPKGALGRVRKAAEAVGIGATELRVPYAFHSHGLAGVAHDFAARAGRLVPRPARHLLYSAILGRYVDGGPADHAALASAHLVRPTRFADAVRVLHAEGADVFVECGAKGVLTDLVTSIAPGVRAVAPLRRRVGGEEFAEAVRRAVGAEDVAGVRSGAGAENVARLRSGPGARDVVAAWREPVVDGAAARRGPAAPGGAREWPAHTPRPAPETPPRPVDRTPHSPALPTHPELVGVLRDLYAQALGYPPDVLTPDADLEADLGVDSIKQVELFSQALDRYGRALPPDGHRLTSHTTLDALAELLLTLPGTAAR